MGRFISIILVMRLITSLMKIKTPKLTVSWNKGGEAATVEGQLLEHPGFSRETFNKYPTRKLKPLGYKGNYVLAFGGIVLVVIAFGTFKLSSLPHTNFVWYNHTGFCPDLNLKAGEQLYNKKQDEKDSIEE